MHRCTDLRHLYGLDFMTFLLFSYGVFQGTVTKENCCSLGNMQYTSVHHSIPFQCIPLRHMNLQTKSSELLKSCLDLHLLEESTEHSTIGNNMEHPSDPVWSPSRNSSSSFCIPKGAKHGKILHVHLQTKVFNIAMLRSREQQEILESSNPFRSRVLILIIYFIYIYIFQFLLNLLWGLSCEISTAMVIGRSPILEDCEGAPTPKAPARPASGF